MKDLEPITREETMLAKVAGQDVPTLEPVTREEFFLAKAAGQDVPELEPITREEYFLADVIEAIESGGGGGTGLSDEAKIALLNCFAHVAWADENGQDYYDALEEALNPPVPPVPPAELVSISAVYTQSGTVYDTDTLDSLKADLVVTATYDDSTTEAVTTYTLSGTLTAGTSTITVSYGGKTDTFTVTVTHAADEWDYTWTPASGTFNDAGFTVIKSSDRITYDSAGATIVGKTDNASAPKITIPETSSHYQIEYVIQPVVISGHNNSGFHANLTYGGGKYTSVRIATALGSGQSVYGVTRYTTGTYTNIDTVHYIVGTDYKILIDYNALGNLKVSVDDVQILDVAVGTESNSNGNILWALDGTYLIKSLKCKAVV